MQRAQDAGQGDMLQIPGVNIPFRWLVHPDIQPLVDAQAPLTFNDVPNTLPVDKVPRTIYTVLSHENELMETAESLFPNQQPQIFGIDSMLVQMGRKTYIVVCQMKTSAGNAGFAIYLGRNPNGTELGNEAEADFHNLRNLHKQAELRLTSKATKKYKFLNPIALLASVKIAGHEYSSFTMPFIEDYGELRADVYENPQLGMRLPFFRYALTFTKRMKDHNEATYKKVFDLGNTYGHLLNRFPDKSPEYILTQLTRASQCQTIKKQMKDVLIGNALIFLLSDGHFPKDFMINAGDWMVNFPGDGLNLYLITVRGGLEYVGSEEAWKERMKEQYEVVPGREMKGLAMPIFYGQDDLIESSLDEAGKLLIKQ